MVRLCHILRCNFLEAGLMNFLKHDNKAIKVLQNGLQVIFEGLC